MVCDRCISAVTHIVQNVGLHPESVQLGEVQILENDISSVKQQLDDALQSAGFELLDDKIEKTVEKIKNLITDLVHSQNNLLRVNLSDYLSSSVHMDYSTISNLFSATEGMTIEHYYILQKIEKVKELLSYGELSLSEIAHQLHYSSVAYLSSQFKKVTGITATQYKNKGTPDRNALDKLV